MKSKLEIGLIEGENLLKKGGIMLINNIGKTVALITLLVAALVTFTNVSFADFKSEIFATSAMMLMLASYLMYFSLEDAGEKLGEESEEYLAVLKRYEEESKKIKGEDMEGLREFCLLYSREELEYRQKAYIISHGLSVSQFNKYKNGEKTDKNSSKIFKRVAKLRPVNLTPKSLLTKERESHKSELVNPEKFKLLHLILKLIPTTVCMTVTVSVMLTAKEGLDAAAVIEGILKLATLPIVGFRGYANGYSYVRKCYVPWIQTKIILIEAYNEKKALPLDFRSGI